MGNSTLPYLFVTQVVLMVLAVRSAQRTGRLSPDRAQPAYIVIALLILWAPISAFLALEGVYTQPAVLEKLPGLWVTMVPVLVLMVPWGRLQGFHQ